MQKRCSKCKETKNDSEFSLDRGRKDLLTPWCKTCQKARWHRFYVKKRSPAPVNETERVCASCNAARPIDRFAKAKRSLGGRLRRCRECINEETRAKPKKPPKRKRNSLQRWKYGLKEKYGITPETYHTMLEAQGGVCDICSTAVPEPAGRQKHFHVDHCHESNKIRGLLCSSCNNGLGRFSHDHNRVLAAALYLERHSA